MACKSGGSDSMLSDIACPICLEPYKNPKSLSCGHSLCEKCVSDLVTRQQNNVGLGGSTVFGPTGLQSGPTLHTRINCPQCRKSTSVPQKGLPTNYELAEILNRFSVLDTKDSKFRPCSICQQAFREDQFWHCVNCAQTLPQNQFCSKCGLKEHNGHKVVELSELKEHKTITLNKINNIRAQTLTDVQQIQVSNDRIQETLNNILQAMDQYTHSSYGRLFERLNSLDICGTDMMDECVEEARNSQHSIIQILQNITQTQRNSLDMLQTCLNGLLEMLNKPNFSVDDAESTAEIIVMDAEGVMADRRRKLEHLETPHASTSSTNQSIHSSPDTDTDDDSTSRTVTGRKILRPKRRVPKKKTSYIKLNDNNKDN